MRADEIVAANLKRYAEVVDKIDYVDKHGAIDDEASEQERQTGEELIADWNGRLVEKKKLIDDDGLQIDITRLDAASVGAKIFYTNENFYKVEVKRSASGATLARVNFQFIDPFLNNDKIIAATKNVVSAKLLSTLKIALKSSLQIHRIHTIVSRYRRGDSLEFILT